MTTTNAGMGGDTASGGAGRVVLVGIHSRTRTGAVGAVLRTPGARREEAASRDRSLQIVRIFGTRLMPRLNHLARTLSYANRRRLEISRALVSEPLILLLDEPTAGKDPTETLEQTDQIRFLRDRGLTILLIEHKLDVVNKIADTVVFDHGEKIAESAPAAGPGRRIRSRLRSRARTSSRHGWRSCAADLAHESEDAVFSTARSSRNFRRRTAPSASSSRC